MFYIDVVETRLRFGDVLEGYLSTTPILDKPFVEHSNEPYNIDVQLPQFCVVMDPCCNIGDGTISLTPLIQIKSHFWDNPHLFRDITTINREMPPVTAIHPQKWSSLSLEDKQLLINASPQYNHLNFFVFEENDLFPPYTVRKKLKYEEKIDQEIKLPIFEVKQEKWQFDTKYYMIDFKKTYHVNCRRISKPTQKTDDNILASKVLQLSIETRNELRDKMSFYYGNPPEEDTTD